LPIPLTIQTAAGFFLSARDIGAITISATADEAAWFAVAATFVLANVVGMRSSRQLRTNDRQRFAALRQQRRAHDTAMAAMEEVRVLRGLLPICAWCRRIHEDDGSWQQFETYVANHTQAEFTHGICPDCYAAEVAKL
jgi:hypothetical protein